ncbi:MAG TPA: holo-ACP synthase [Candidatus Binatia bacterium]|nr:holo-ACP synthase [Candidatus Binatia bacterium]
MIYGVGIDVLRVERIEKVHRRHGQRFVERLLHPSERAAFARARKPALFLAKAFAVKEAFVKALGTGFRDVAHDDVGSTRDALGKPELVYSRGLAAMLKRLKIRAAHVSLSDEGGIVGAVVVLEK